MYAVRIANLIGAVGGLVFILVNAGGLPGAAGPVARILGIAGFVFIVWYAVLRPRPDLAPGDAPDRKAMRVYWICVAAEVAAIPAGAMVLNNVLDLPEITVCWVVFVVGAHFLPFAKAFEAPVFVPFGWTLIALAVVGAALTLAVSEQAAAWTAVLTGVVFYLFSYLGARAVDRSAAALAER